MKFNEVIGQDKDRYNYDVKFRIICPIGFKIDKELEFRNLKLKEQDDNIAGILKLALPTKTPCMAEIEVFAEEEAETLLNALALSGVGLLIDPETVVVGNCIRIQVYEPIQIDDSLIEIAEKYLDALKSLPGDKKDGIMRAIKWWRRGYVEKDPLDKFINCYIALEILGEIKYPNMAHTQKVKQICKDYGLKCKYRGEDITRIRGALLHFGEKAEIIEEVAHEFSLEVLKALRKVVEELFNQ